MKLNGYAREQNLLLQIPVVAHMSPSSQEKKRFSIVHKPFEQGKVNLFNPPKKNPNGHVASAKIWDDDVPDSSSSEIIHDLEDICDSEDFVDQQIEIDQQINNSAKKYPSFLNSWKIAAAAIIILGNLSAVSILMWHKHKSVKAAAEIANSTPTYISGKTNLAKQEFQKLDLQSLKNIESQSQDVVVDKATDNASLPLAIPPSNIPKDVIFSQSQVAKKYFYILADYTGEESLDLAKSKVPNVSLVNFPQGVFIYMGAFVKKESANQFINSLKESGLESRIYPSE